jgi:hypothetical protein
MQQFTGLTPTNRPMQPDGNFVRNRLWTVPVAPSAVMPSNLDNVILTFPPRPISQWERAVLAEWFAATKRKGLDIAEAFVSERRGDDPSLAGSSSSCTRTANPRT